MQAEGFTVVQQRLSKPVQTETCVPRVVKGVGIIRFSGRKFGVARQSGLIIAFFVKFVMGVQRAGGVNPRAGDGEDSY